MIICCLFLRFIGNHHVAVFWLELLETVFGKKLVGVIDVRGMDLLDLDEAALNFD